MRTPFGTDWDDLNLNHLESFFRELPPGEEGLLWEAKGTKWPHRDSVRKHACGFANQLGGYLVIGVDELTDGWEVVGVPQPSHVAEPSQYLCQVARAGLDPAPFVDAKAFTRGGRVVAVLRVDPVAAPPCVVDGRVFQRVTGETEPVTDASVLASLISRGEAANDRALEAVRVMGREARPLLNEHVQAESLKSGVAVALSPIARPRSAQVLLFTRRFEAAVIRELQAALDLPGAWVAGRLQVRHDAFSLRVTLESDDEVWSAECALDGAVCLCVYQRSESQALRTIEYPDTLRRPLAATNNVLRLLGSDAPAWLALAHWDGVPSMIGMPYPEPATVVRRLPELLDPHKSDLGALLRDLQRAQGRLIYDPSPESD